MRKKDGTYCFSLDRKRYPDILEAEYVRSIHVFNYTARQMGIDVKMKASILLKTRFAKCKTKKEKEEQIAVIQSKINLLKVGITDLI